MKRKPMEKMDNKVREAVRTVERQFGRLIEWHHAVDGDYYMFRSENRQAKITASMVAQTTVHQLVIQLINYLFPEGFTPSDLGWDVKQLKKLLENMPPGKIIQEKTKSATEQWADKWADELGSK